MATFNEVKTRVALEMNKDDLADGEELGSTLENHINEAIEFFSDEKFYFNSVIVEANTTAGAINMDVPASVRRIDRIMIPNELHELQEVTLDEIDQFDDGAQARPDAYAYYNDQIRFWPIPDAVYSLRFTGLKQIDAPTGDNSNEWTTTALNLIVSRAKMTLSRDVYRDSEAVGLYGAATKEALQNLKGETARRLQAPLRVRPYDMPMLGRTYNINRDW